MEKNKVLNHCYPTRRNKIPKLEENSENSVKNSSALSKTKNAESPSATRFCMISGYASPPCRLVTLSQQNENEIEWDLTSPSARKYQVLFSDKKTSTPNCTPTRSKRELRPRIALCKKNIALTEDKNVDLVNELAALNELVNSEQAQTIITPPQSVKGQATKAYESSEEQRKPGLTKNLNTSDIFDDDSFFSESILLSTQAIEEEAIGCNRTPIKKKRPIDEPLMTPRSNSPNRSFPLLPSPEGNSTRKSFDLDEDDCDQLKVSLTTIISTSAVPKAEIQDLTIRNEEPQFSKQQSTRKIESDPSNPNVFQAPVKTVPKYGNQNKSVNKVDSSRSRQLNSTVNCKGDSSPRWDKPRGNVLDKLPRPLPNTRGNVQKPPKPSSHQVLSSATSCKLNSPHHSTKSANSIDLFDDDDDDLLCAIADEVESQYVPVSSTSKVSDDSDDGFFQPEVLAYISQIESQATSTVKSTADLLEEKRQAAIRKREERLMNRR